MVVATDTVAGDVATGFISVCADPGVTGNIDRPGAKVYLTSLGPSKFGHNLFIFHPISK